MKVAKEVKIGIILTASLAFLIYGFNFLKGRNVFTNERVFYGIYPHIDGLVKTNPVIVNGYQVGMVKETQLIHDQSGRILVTLAIGDPNFAIPSNTIARIISSDLLGSKAIALIMGNSPKVLQNKDTLITDVEMSLSESVNQQVKPLKDKAESLISSVDSILTVVQAVLNKDAQEDLTNSFNTIHQAIYNLERTSLRLDTLVAEEKIRISSIFRNLESITKNLEGNNDHISAVMANLHEISDSLAGAELANTLRSVDRSVSELSSMMEKVNRGEGTLGNIIHNDSLYYNLENSAKSLDRLLIDMRDNPNRYVHFSIFGRRDRAEKPE